MKQQYFDIFRSEHKDEQKNFVKQNIVHKFNNIECKHSKTN